MKDWRGEGGRIPTFGAVAISAGLAYKALCAEVESKPSSASPGSDIPERRTDGRISGK